MMCCLQTSACRPTRILVRSVFYPFFFFLLLSTVVSFYQTASRRVALSFVLWVQMHFKCLLCCQLITANFGKVPHVPGCNSVCVFKRQIPLQKTLTWRSIMIGWWIWGFFVSPVVSKHLHFYLHFIFCMLLLDIIRSDTRPDIVTSTSTGFVLQVQN